MHGLSVAEQMWASSLLEERNHSYFHRGISLPNLRSLVVITLLTSVEKPSATQDYVSIPYLISIGLPSLVHQILNTLAAGCTGCPRCSF